MSGVAATIVRTTARDLDEAELEGLGSEIEPMPSEPREYTEAEVALLELDGYDIDMTGGASTNFDAAHGEVVFVAGKGAGQFKGVMVDHTMGADLVNVYNRRGEKVPVRRDQLVHILGKQTPEGRAYFARPPQAAPILAFSCPSREKPCRKKFETQLQAEDHFMHRHVSEYGRRQRNDDIERDNRDRQLAERQMGVLEQLAKAQGADLTNLEPVDLKKVDLPKRSWSKQRIVEFFEARGRVFTAVELAMTKFEIYDLCWGKDE